MSKEKRCIPCDGKAILIEGNENLLDMQNEILGKKPSCSTCGDSGECYDYVGYQNATRVKITCPDCKQQEEVKIMDDKIREVIAGDFVKALGWYNGNVDYNKDIDEFVLRTASMNPSHEATFNELYKMYKAGIATKETEISELKEALKGADLMIEKLRQTR